jgi:hypothetical protein
MLATRHDIEAQSARLVASVFSSAVLLDLAKRGRSALISSVVRESRDPELRAGVRFADFFETCHARLWAHYRSEYVYKNAIASKILLGRHSVRSARLLTEFRVDQSKADVVLINGTSTCYEIKTELDDLSRLAPQLEAYCRVFDKTYVVTFPEYASKLQAMIPAAVGLLVLTEGYSLRTVAQATSNRANVVPASIFDSLRRDEYTQILRETIGHVPSVPNTRMYTECRRLFCELPPTIAHDGMVHSLRRRVLSPEVGALAETVVPSLKAAVLAAPLSAKHAARLGRILDRGCVQ